LIIEKSPRFKDELEVIVDFIAKDSVNRALAFYDELLAKINQIPQNLYIHRKRLKLIEIDKTNNKIIILGIFNQNLWQ